MNQDDQDVVRDSFGDLLKILCQPIALFLEDLENEKIGKIAAEKNLHGRVVRCLKGVKKYMGQALHISNPRLADLVQLDKGVLLARGFGNAIKTFECFERILRSRGLGVHMRFTRAEMRQIQIYAASSGLVMDVQIVMLGDAQYVSCPDCRRVLRIVGKS